MQMNFSLDLELSMGNYFIFFLVEFLTQCNSVLPRLDSVILSSKPEVPLNNVATSLDIP